MRALLDVNVLLALFDASHQQHRSARQWLEANIETGWASCAITQNGVVRILSQPAYPGSIATRDAIAKLAKACASPHHAFWHCDVSVCDAQIDRRKIAGHRQVTDAYLLGLATYHGGRFVTFDRRLDPSCVPEAAPANLAQL